MNIYYGSHRTVTEKDAEKQQNKLYEKNLSVSQQKLINNVTETIVYYSTRVEWEL